MVSLRLVKRIITYLVSSALLFVFILYVVYTGERHADYVRNPRLKCNHPQEEIDQLLNLTFKVHKILDSFGVDHWLMYGSIFGAIRTQGPLPWDYDVDVGIRGEQFLEIKKIDFFDAFTASGLQYTDHLHRNGLIGVGKPGWNLGVDVFTFYDYDGIMKRPGWASWLLFVNYELHHTFPSRLVRSPLPQTKFGFFNITVPRGGNEILKYLYRFDWWKVVKPLSCG